MKENAKLRRIETNFGALEYLLTYEKIDAISLGITADKAIFISLPYGTDATVADSFVLDKQDYLYSRLAQLSLTPPTIKRQYITGDTFFYLGGSLTLEVVEDNENMAVIKEDMLYLYTKTPEDMEKNKKLVDRWFSIKRGSIFSRINNEIYEKFRTYKTPKAKLIIEHMTDKWGSCQPGRGVITLNTQLIDIPREAIEYVMVHEYAHFVHSDHSQSFHKVVAAVLPDWESRKNKLELSSFNKGF